MRNANTHWRWKTSTKNNALWWWDNIDSYFNEENDCARRGIAHMIVNLNRFIMLTNLAKAYIALELFLHHMGVYGRTDFIQVRID